MTTQRFAKSKMDTFYPGTAAALQTDCIVELSPRHLVVKYMNSGALVEYFGESAGDGHYLFSGKGFEASGTLHLASSATGPMLEGSWKEGGAKEIQQFGMWRIYLESED